MHHTSFLTTPCTSNCLLGQWLGTRKYSNPSDGVNQCVQGDDCGTIMSTPPP
eukprot:NODE_1018_length_2648_cov_48.343118.p15 GENE.NODE_1018_length_2648_cov_48.343118~~NODE_1018_length_2648_cov_48.343118.p15  ORF type:complete len:52 (-),score=0.34 NODE_1018_length_2648_cov_48.343118:1107-1262(-)